MIRQRHWHLQAEQIILSFQADNSLSPFEIFRYLECIAIDQDINQSIFLQSLYLPIFFIVIQLFIVDLHQFFTHFLQGGRAIKLDCKFYRPSLKIKRNEEYLHLVLRRYRQRYQQEGIKANRYLLAKRTNNSRLELPNHQIPHIGHDSLLIIQLTLPTHLLIRLDIVTSLKCLLLLH
jgi:hypothetical protein